MRYLHTMVRISDVDASLRFYCDLLGLKEVRRSDRPEHGYMLIFVAADDNPDSQIELTYNYDPEEYTGGRNFGHLAFNVEDIYATCQSPDGIPIELLQSGDALEPAEPWASMENTGSW